MPTSHIIYLDVDDEITSAATRIRAAEASRLALVVPPGSRIATSRMNFRLLAREAGRLGRRLAVIAPDAPSRALAAAAGLDAFASVGEFEAGLGAGAAPGPQGPAGAPGDGPESDGDAGAPGPRADGRREPLGGAAEWPAATVDAASPAASDESSRGQQGGAPPGGPALAADASPAAGVGPVPATRVLPIPAGLRRPGRHGRLVVLAVAALALALVVGGVAAYVFLPSATVRVVPRIDPVGPLELSVVADPAVSAVDVAAGRIPATRVPIPIRVEDHFPATGQRIVETKATGTVVFTSRNTATEVEIPAGTQVQTANGIVFRTTRRVVVPKATFLPPTPGVVEAPIEALLAGPAGNVPAGAISRVSTVIQARLVNPDDPVSNPEPTSGGKRDVFPRISQADVDAALAALRQRAETALRDGLAHPDLVPTGLTVFAATAILGELTPTVDPTTLVGKEATGFDLGLTGEGSVLGVDEMPIQEIAEAKIRGQIAAGHAFVDGSLQVQVGEPIVQGMTIRFPVTTAARQTVVVDPDALRAAIKGRPIEEARRLLEAYGTVSIRVWPDWITTIPSLDSRLELVVGPEGGASRSTGARRTTGWLGRTWPSRLGGADRAATAAARPTA